MLVNLYGSKSHLLLELIAGNTYLVKEGFLDLSSSRAVLDIHLLLCINLGVAVSWTWHFQAECLWCLAVNFEQSHGDFSALKAPNITGAMVWVVCLCFRVVWFVLNACQKNLSQLIKSSVFKQSLSFLLLKNRTSGFVFGVWEIRWHWLFDSVPRIKRHGNSREKMNTGLTFLTFERP